MFLLLQSRLESLQKVIGIAATHMRVFERSVTKGIGIG